MIVDKIKYISRADESDLDETIELLTQLIVESGDREFKAELAEVLIDFCDLADEDDMFGTEGWRHRVN